MTPPIPVDEGARLEALCRLDVLDTPQERAFDRIAQVAARMFRAPMALVSLVDSNRQWFKAKVGVAVAETPRDIAFCAHAILSESLMVVPDAALDPRFACNPLVTGEPHVRFYAGAPLRTDEGFAVGVLCIMDVVPRPDLDADQARTLSDLAALVMDEFRLRSAFRRQVEMEAAYRASVDGLASLVAATPSALLTIDEQATILTCNPATERIFGYSAAELAGQPTALLVPERYRGDHQAAFRAYVEREDKSTGWDRTIMVGRRKDGSEVPLECLLVDYKDRGRRVITAIFNDQTAYRTVQSELSLSRRQYRSLVENLKEVVFQTDAAGLWTFLNRSWTEITGYSVADSLGRNFLEFVHPEDRQRNTELFAPLIERRKEYCRHEVRYLTCDGGFRWVEVYARLTLDDDDRILGTSGTLKDITGRKRVELELRAAKEEAERARNAKNDFLSRVSHELRTPLNAVLGFAQLMEMDDLNPEQRENTERILRSGRHLLNLTNDILDISSIESGRLTLDVEAIYPLDLMAAAVDLARPLLAGRSIQLVQPAQNFERLPILADRHRLTQVLLNLLSNAVKYNRENGQVILSCERRTGNRLRILVTDTGQGIPEDRLPRLFQPFERLGAERSRVEGTGLGLALAKCLTELMGGSIGVESVLGQGSTFWIELPGLDLADRGQEKSCANPLHHDPNRPAVLYIEDNTENIALVEHILKRRPLLKFLPAAQGSLGLELAREHAPAVILLDIYLPDMSGVEVLRRLRDDPATQETPVIVISIDGLPATRRQLLEAGACEYLTKPLDVRQFLGALDKSLETRVPPESRADSVTGRAARGDAPAAHGALVP